MNVRLQWLCNGSTNNVANANKWRNVLSDREVRWIKNNTPLKTSKISPKSFGLKWASLTIIMTNSMPLNSIRNLKRIHTCKDKRQSTTVDKIQTVTQQIVKLYNKTSLLPTVVRERERQRRRQRDRDRDSAVCPDQTWLCFLKQRERQSKKDRDRETEREMARFVLTRPG